MPVGAWHRRVRACWKGWAKYWESGSLRCFCLLEHRLQGTLQNRFSKTVSGCLLTLATVRWKTYLVKSQLLFKVAKIKNKPLPAQGIFVRLNVLPHFPQTRMFSDYCDNILPTSSTKIPSVRKQSATWCLSMSQAKGGLFEPQILTRIAFAIIR